MVIGEDLHPKNHSLRASKEKEIDSDSMKVDNTGDIGSQSFNSVFYLRIVLFASARWLCIPENKHTEEAESEKHETSTEKAHDKTQPDTTSAEVKRISVVEETKYENFRLLHYI